MTMDKIIYGEINLEKNLDRDIKMIIQYISMYDKVGLQATQGELDLYREINNAAHPPGEAEKVLMYNLSKKYNYNRGEWSKYSSSQSFWFRLLIELDKTNADIRGLGSEKIIRFLNETIAEYSDYPQIHDMILGPHFDRFGRLITL